MEVDYFKWSSFGRSKGEFGRLIIKWKTLKT